MKVHILTLDFDNTERILRTIDRFFNETDIEGIELTYTVIDARYPYPDKGANMLNLCQAVGIQNMVGCYPVPLGLVILDRNHGQTGNYNALRDRFEYADDDILVFYDTDVRPNKRSWLKDKIAVFGDPKTAFVAINCSCTDNALQHQGQYLVVNGIPCRDLTWPGGWATGAWLGKLFRRGCDVTHEFYGGTEYNIMCAYRAMGMSGFMLCEHDDLRDTEGWDEPYIQWKHAVIAIAGKQVDFESYLRERGLIR